MCPCTCVCPEEEATCGKDSRAEENAEEIGGDAACGEENVGRSPEDIGGDSEDATREEDGSTRQGGSTEDQEPGQETPEETQTTCRFPGGT
ncbi:hypothetical protein NDU88_001891 [Pleurodeles waltl]|uniref:Uncharacterized protein n=1 Tax=Pleurodeles waltl TaxID=8319 RepID=A0AAV7P844_PLEWA|nr:hypothetical protein NDU88_001891 [Pleurodeles waltl]